MSWKETCVMDQRMSFVVACLDGVENFSELCRHFGISRRTGYKWLARYKAAGVAGLQDRSRAPHGNSRALDEKTVAAVLAVRRRHPTWGPRKVKAWLELNKTGLAWPAASSIGNVFDRKGLTRQRKKGRQAPPYGRPFLASDRANDVWCIDFKGWFLTGDNTRVDPLTLSDAVSRYLLYCQAVEACDEAHVWPVLEAAFYEFGLPEAMRSDNGPPFAGHGAAGLSVLSVKLIKIGVMPERIVPGKPQQNGRHERMHLTLKQDTASPPAASLQEQMARFDEFRAIYNNERPHEALGQKPPASVYQPSPRNYDGILRSPDYDHHVSVRKVRHNGEMKWRGRSVFVSHALKGEPVGLYEIAEDCWLVKYGPFVLGTIKGAGKIHRTAR